MKDDKPALHWGRRPFKWWRYHVALGLHSNFPPCCILWFITVWPMIVRNLWLSNWFRGAGYVRCPFCVLLKRTVEVRHCHCMWACNWKEEHARIEAIRKAEAA